MKKMKKGLKWFAIMIMFGILGCGSKEKITQTKLMVVHDTLIHHQVKTVRLPVRNITRIENPCRGDSIKPIDQVLTVGGSRFTIESIEGSIVAEIESEKDSTTSSEKQVSRDTVKTEIVTETIIKTRTPKWIWWSLGLNFVLLGWMFRKPIQSALKRFIFPI